jgi:hypothetical protein
MKLQIKEASRGTPPQRLLAVTAARLFDGSNIRCNYARLSTACIYREVGMDTLNKNPYFIVARNVFQFENFMTMEALVELIHHFDLALNGEL